MYQAEWDFEREVVLRVKNTPTSDPTSTGLHHEEGNETRWLDVEDEYPPGWVEGYADLGGPATFHYNEDRDLLIRRYPHAEFTIENIRAVQVDRIMDLLAYTLRPTDFYVIRQVEIGTPVPENISVARQQVYERADQWLAVIESNPDDEVPDVDFMEIERDMTFPETHYPRFMR